MADAFSYTFDLSSDKKILKFIGQNGEKYLLIHELSWTVYGNSILNLIVECNSKKQYLITAELCSTNVSPVKTAALFENCTANLNFQNVNFLTPDPWRCIIEIIPHMQLHHLQESSTVSPSLITSKKSAIKKVNLEKLSEDFKNIQRIGDLSDVVLSDGTTEIRAHKVILSARSPVFAKMFSHRMKENCENCVKISDIPGDALSELVTYIYTGTITLKDSKMARDLYIAADKYAVIDLKKLCAEILQNVTFDDVLDTLALADLYEDKMLKQSTLNFIALNYSQVKNTKNWDSFTKENQALAIEILSFIIENKM